MVSSLPVKLNQPRYMYFYRYIYRGLNVQKRDVVLTINNVLGTCHGYSFSSVSTPPTILVLVWTCPQLQVVVGILLEEVVVTGDVVVDGDDVVVEVDETKHDKINKNIKKGVLVYQYQYCW